MPAMPLRVPSAPGGVSWRVSKSTAGGCGGQPCLCCCPPLPGGNRSQLELGMLGGDVQCGGHGDGVSPRGQPGIYPLSGDLRTGPVSSRVVGWTGGAGNAIYDPA